MRLARILGLVGALLATHPAGAMGIAEAPAQIETRTWDWNPITKLEVRGDIELTLKPGTRTRLTVETTRALFDQLWVSDWWGWGAIKVDQGLIGARELGHLKATLETPSLAELVVSDHSVAQVDWPGPPGKLMVYENSLVALQGAGGTLVVEGRWRSAILLHGTLDGLNGTLRQQSILDATDLTLGQASVILDEASLYRGGPTGSGTAVVRQNSRLEKVESPPWTIQGEPTN